MIFPCIHFLVYKRGRGSKKNRTRCKSLWLKSCVVVVRVFQPNRLNISFLYSIFQCTIVIIIIIQLCNRHSTHLPKQVPSSCWSMKIIIIFIILRFYQHHFTILYYKIFHFFFVADAGAHVITLHWRLFNAEQKIVKKLIVIMDFLFFNIDGFCECICIVVVVSVDGW